MLGRFSPGAVGIRLDWSCDWRRQSGTPPYWRHRRLALEVAAPERGLVLAAYGPTMGVPRLLAHWHNPGPSPLAGPDEPGGSELLRGLLAGSALFAYLPLLPASVGAPAGLPLSNLWLAARRDGDRYRLGALAELDQVPNPRLLQSLVLLATAAWLRKAGLGDLVARLKELEVEVSGRTVSVSGLSLGEGELLQALGFRPRAVNEETGGAGGGG